MVPHTTRGLHVICSQEEAKELDGPIAIHGWPGQVSFGWTSELLRLAYRVLLHEGMIWLEAN